MGRLSHGVKSRIAETLPLSETRRSNQSMGSCWGDSKCEPKHVPLGLGWCVHKGGHTHCKSEWGATHECVYEVKAEANEGMRE